MKMTWGPLSIACLVCALVACSSDDDSPSDAGTDTEQDTSVSDVGNNDTGNDTAEDTADDTAEDVANDAADDTVDDVDVRPLVLSTISDEVFTPTCATIDCHEAGNTENALDLSDTPGLMDRLREESLLGYQYIDDTLDESHLYLLLTGREQEIFGVPGYMPPEEDGGPLEEEQIDLVRRWIEAGAPE